MPQYNPGGVAPLREDWTLPEPAGTYDPLYGDYLTQPAPDDYDLRYYPPPYQEGEVAPDLRYLPDRAQEDRGWAQPETLPASYERPAEQAPDFVRNLPSSAVARDERVTQGDDFMAGVRSWIGDRWQDIRESQIAQMADQYIGPAAELLVGASIRHPETLVAGVPGLIAGSLVEPIEEALRGPLAGPLTGIARSAQGQTESADELRDLTARLSEIVNDPSRGPDDPEAQQLERQQNELVANLASRYPGGFAEINPLAELGLGLLDPTQLALGGIPGKAERAGAAIARGVVRGRAARLAEGIAEELPKGARAIELTREEEIARLRLEDFPEALRPIIQDAAEGADFARAQRRGIIPDVSAQALADDLTKERMFDDWIRGAKAGKAYNEEQLIALRNAERAQGAKVSDAADAVAAARTAGENVDQALVIWRSEQQKLGALTAIVEGGRAESGRAQRAFQQATRLVDLPTDEAVVRINRDLGGSDNALEAISEYQQLVKDGANPIQLANFWARVEKPPPGAEDWFRLIRYNSMLSGPRTMEINMVGNAAEVPWRLARDFGASLARGRPEEMIPETVGAFVGFQRGVPKAVEVILHGITSEQAAQGALPPSVAARIRNPALRPMATALESVGRTLQAGDQLAIEMGYSMALGREAGKAASATGLQGKAWQTAVADFLIDPDKAAMKRAMDVALRMTYKGEMGSLGRAMEPLASHPVGNVIMPFLRTVYHITARGVDVTPLGGVGTAIDVARGVYKPGRELPKGVVPLGERAYDNIAGTLIGGYLVGQALGGDITGQGPQDTERRADLQATGWQPNSLRIGDRYVSYANWGRFAVPLSLAASVAEASLYAKPDAGVGQYALDAAHRFIGLVENQSFLQGVDAFYKVLNNPRQYGEQYIAQLAQTVVPFGSAISTAAQALETQGARAPEGIIERLKVRAPGLRQQVPVKLNVLGEPVPEVVAGPLAFQPFRMSQVVSQPVLEEMERLTAKGYKTSIGQLEPHIDKVELTKDEQRELQIIYGGLVKTQLGRLIDRPTYQRARPATQAEMLEDEEHELREAARDRFVRAHPDFKDRVRAQFQKEREKALAR